MRALYVRIGRVYFKHRNLEALIMENLDKEYTYIYELEDGNNYNKCKYLIKCKMKSEEIKNLIFYIQYKYQGIMQQDLLSANEIKEILEKFYQAENVDCVEFDEVIDVKENFKRCFNNVRGRNILDNYFRCEVSGLMAELRKIADLTIEMWR